MNLNMFAENVLLNDINEYVNQMETALVADDVGCVVKRRVAKSHSCIAEVEKNSPSPPEEPEKNKKKKKRYKDVEVEPDICFGGSGDDSDELPELDCIMKKGNITLSQQEKEFILSGSIVKDDAKEGDESDYSFNLSDICEDEFNSENADLSVNESNQSFPKSEDFFEVNGSVNYRGSEHDAFAELENGFDENDFNENDFKAGDFDMNDFNIDENATEEKKSIDQNQSDIVAPNRGDFQRRWE